MEPSSRLILRALPSVKCWAFFHGTSTKKAWVRISKDKKVFRLLKCAPFAKEKFCEIRYPPKIPVCDFKHLQKDKHAVNPILQLTLVQRQIPLKIDHQFRSKVKHPNCLILFPIDIRH